MICAIRSGMKTNDARKLTHSTLTEMKGSFIKTVLEDVADNLFNPDPYYQQGGDMVRVGGLQYRCDPKAAMGSRISDMRLDDKPIEASKTYKVAGWAPVAEGAQGEPIWEVVESWLADRKTVSPISRQRRSRPGRARLRNGKRDFLANPSSVRSCPMR